MRIAVIADIHGNVLALEAVLADIADREIERTINLGDLVSGPLWPRETLELLAPLGLLTLRGNHDRWVAGPDPAGMYGSDRYAHGELTPAQRSWLGALPSAVDAGDGIIAFHARPDDDNAYLIEDVADGRLVRAPASSIRARLGATAARIILCGHSHLAHVVQLPDGPLIVNPGSVGCPAYDDPTADPHVSEAAAPFARYAILTLEGEQVVVELIAIPYPWEQAARRAEQNGRHEWAYALRTGFIGSSP
jgi:predicted phosphodiesterase